MSSRRSILKFSGVAAATGLAGSRRTGPRDGPGDDLMKVADEVLDFKTVREKGRAGKIKSITSPPLASHVRCEAVRFIDELKRTQAG